MFDWLGRVEPFPRFRNLKSQRPHYSQRGKRSLLCNDQCIKVKGENFITILPNLIYHKRVIFWSIKVTDFISLSSNKSQKTKFSRIYPQFHIFSFNWRFKALLKINAFWANYIKFENTKYNTWIKIITIIIRSGKNKILTSF
jgi:hypothetical protein